MKGETYVYRYNILSVLKNSSGVISGLPIHLAFVRFLSVYYYVNQIKRNLLEVF